ncbi:hypothetical protein pETSU_015 [Edwardsiella phage pEt-SU]|uniref:Uncharacterized protein n=1 Tax=Edwardsiella phage pEt-SU TaxID=2562142 RepID=A0A4D6DXN0_9CAUD|nr:hypothetical protein HOV39_gp015 [Edwardsiella phage pEt-SU]QBZ70596.1 hypothetical protein pETSU_015 [Edwardsiella phage pEt-SU]
MNKLNKLYEAMLKSWGCTLDEQSAIFLNFSGTSVPVKVDDKQVYLPTSENLNGITIGKVFFHPACESIMSKETEIFKVIRKLSSAKIYAVFQPIFEVLVAVANKKSGKTLTGKTLELLEPFKAVTKSVKEEVINLIKTISITLEDTGLDTRLITFSMIKGGKNDDDQPIYYTATPSFPFYTELYRTAAQNEHLKSNERITFNNLNVSMQAVRTVIALFEIALPACTDPSRKKYSVTTSEAARLVAYLHSYSLVVSDMNSLIGKFRKEFDAIGIYGVDLDWVSDLDEIGEIKGLIPALDYNNYNTTSAPETPAANSGARISSYNPMANVMNTVSQQVGFQAPQATTAAPVNAPKVPDALPGEVYQGCDYSPTNGIFEFKFQQANGMVRIRRLAEDGRFVSEDFQNPMQQGQMNPAMMNTMMNPAMMMMMNSGMMNNGMMNPAMMGSGIPMVGIGQQQGPAGMVWDRYTNSWIPGNGMNQPVNNGGFTNNNSGIPNSMDMGFAGTSSINNI